MQARQSDFRQWAKGQSDEQAGDSDEDLESGDDEAEEEEEMEREHNVVVETANPNDWLAIYKKKKEDPDYPFYLFRALGPRDKASGIVTVTGTDTFVDRKAKGFTLYPGNGFF